MLWLIFISSSITAIVLMIRLAKEEWNMTCRICPCCDTEWYSSDRTEDWICSTCGAVITPEEEVVCK